jgi:hypothetical protein
MQWSIFCSAIFSQYTFELLRIKTVAVIRQIEAFPLEGENISRKLITTINRRVVGTQQGAPVPKI